MPETAPPTDLVYVGIDVSADWIDVTREDMPDRRTCQRFDNDRSGHARLCQWIADTGRPARVAVESSGAYSFDLAVALHETDGVEVMVLNPHAAKDYRRAHMHRSTPPRWGGRRTPSTRPSWATMLGGCPFERGPHRRRP